MTMYEEVMVYLERNGFKSVSQSKSNIQIYRHKDGTIVKVEHE